MKLYHRQNLNFDTIIKIIITQEMKVVNTNVN